MKLEPASHRYQPEMLSERDHILDCLQRANNCADVAARTPSNYEAAGFLDMERKWVKLALSYLVAADIRDRRQMQGWVTDKTRA